MIQRIQSVYLLISMILVGNLLLFPIAEILHEGELIIFNRQGLVGPEGLRDSGISFSFFVALVALLHGVIIFSFKNRIRQIRLTVFSILLLFGVSGMIYFFTYYSFPDASISLEPIAVFPLLAIILDYLAIRSIGKDEALIRSINRIR